MPYCTLLHSAQCRTAPYCILLNAILHLIAFYSPAFHPVCWTFSRANVKYVALSESSQIQSPDPPSISYYHTSPFSHSSHLIQTSVYTTISFLSLSHSLSLSLSHSLSLSLSLSLQLKFCRPRLPRGHTIGWPGVMFGFGAMFVGLIGVVMVREMGWDGMRITWCLCVVLLCLSGW
jgi:hypothetical protein